jgi:hypothetical protein
VQHPLASAAWVFAALFLAQAAALAWHGVIGRRIHVVLLLAAPIWVLSLARREAPAAADENDPIHAAGVD